MNVLKDTISKVCKRLFPLSHPFVNVCVKSVSCVVRKSSYVQSIDCETATINQLAPNLIPDKMTSEVSKLTVLDPPASVRGMKILDRDAFSKEVLVPCVVTSPQKIRTALKILKPFQLKLRNFAPVQESEREKTVFLNPVSIESEMPRIEQLLQAEAIGKVSFQTIRLTYEAWGYADIFKAIFSPNTPEGLSSFSIVGHILHLNLKPQSDEYKHIIGQVFLDKIGQVRTVVNKVAAIDNTFRNFQMEVLAGEHEFIVTVKEYGCKYEFDFSEVFWNPRLCTEHNRIANKLKHGDVVFDVFAGVGPFAIPAAKKGCYIYANDLNPHSFKWLCHNVKLNKVNSCVEAFNLDGRIFISTVIRDKLKDLWLDKKTYPDVHIIMNLPALSFEFLDAFKYILPYFDDKVHQEIKLPTVHSYYFMETEGFSDDSVNKIEKIFDCEIKQHVVETAFVRTVAPSKTMMRVSFKIPEKVLFCNGIDVTQEPPCKKIKICD